jgi:fatty acid desaturase
MAVYWVDYLSSIGCATLAIVAFPIGAPRSWPAVVCATVATLALYRSLTFIHEIAHQGRRPEFAAFRRTWNVLCGVPFLVPSFVYDVHLEHHRLTYGSSSDGEYLPFGAAPRWRSVALVAAAPLGVPALVVRFLVLAPIGWVVRPLRRVVLARGSALVIDTDYKRLVPQNVPLQWTLQEAACFAWSGIVLVLAATSALPLARLVEAYAILTAVVALNAVRVLGAHRYRSNGGVTFADQVLDSNDFPRGRLLPELWAPLGLRYHAVHHLFPSLPYHALPEARRRLVAALPPDDPYFSTARASLRSAIRDVLSRASPAP